MNRAEKAALEAYPDYRSMDGGYITQRKPRAHFIKGYEQAEKDLALTWEDIGAIDKLLWDLSPKYSDKTSIEYFDAVLKRFNEKRYEKVKMQEGARYKG